MAGVVKLVDAEDSKSSARKGMSVRFRPPAPYKIKGLSSFLDNPFFDLGDCAHKWRSDVFSGFRLLRPFVFPGIPTAYLMLLLNPFDS